MMATTQLQPLIENEATAANIASATATVNTTEKKKGLQVWDTTNKRMYRASGSAATDPWDAVDASGSVTPS